MGIKERVIIECTCDLCGKECDPKENQFVYNIATAYRDVGPPYISGSIHVTKPYVCADGIVCKQCQKKWLQQYIDSI